MLAAVHQILDMYDTVKMIEEAKRNTERNLLGLDPILPWYQELAVKCMRWLREIVIRPCCPSLLYIPSVREMICPANSFAGLLCTPGTVHNDMFKRTLAFVAGLVISTVWFLFMWYSLDYSAWATLITCSIISVLLSLGMAYVQFIRCMVLLILPQICSGRGRAALFAMAAVLVVQGPVVNIRHNVDIIVQTTTCAQELSYNATMAFIKAALFPSEGMMGAILTLVSRVQEMCSKIRAALEKVKKVYEAIESAIDNFKNWLVNITTRCREKVATPYNQCVQKLPNLIDKICDIVKIGELFCILTNIITNYVKKKVGQKISTAITKTNEKLFKFDVEMVHNYTLNVSVSRTFTDIRKDIMHDIQARIGWMSALGGLTGAFACTMLIMVVIRALLYRHKYLTIDRFDNNYITASITRIDDKRRDMEKETILPLKFKEKLKYISPGRCLLSRSELFVFCKKLLFSMGVICYILFYLLVDYSLYWMLNMFRKHANVKLVKSVPPQMQMHVEGQGALANMYRTLVNQFSTLTHRAPDIDTTACLPNPSQPNYALYKKIGGLLATALLALVLEAYVVRLRHMVMGVYHPAREKTRAVWLYNRILLLRGGFTKVARRRARNQLDRLQQEQQVEILPRLLAMFPVLEKVARLFGVSYKYCLCCGEMCRPYDKDFFVSCTSYDCKAIYCKECYVDLNNICTVCMNPVEYGDLSDFDEERDSSDDEIITKAEKKEDIVDNVKRLFDVRSSQLAVFTDERQREALVQESEVLLKHTLSSYVSLPPHLCSTVRIPEPTSPDILDEDYDLDEDGYLVDGVPEKMPLLRKDLKTNVADHNSDMSFNPELLYNDYGFANDVAYMSGFQGGQDTAVRMPPLHKEQMPKSRALPRANKKPWEFWKLSRR